MFERKQIIGLGIVLLFGLTVLHLVQQYQNVLPDNSSLYAQTSSSSSALFLSSNQNLLNDSSTASQLLLTSSSSSSLASSSLSPLVSAFRSSIITPTYTGNLMAQQPQFKDDFNKLIDLANFEFLINHKMCHRAPLVLILIHSAPLNLHKRNVIRETWGQSDKRALLLFMIGSVETQSMQDDIQMESDKFGDIVQGNFFDTYRNITYKHVMALKWFVYYCSNAKYILKTDDDVFVNTPHIFDSLESSLQMRNLLFCYEISGDRVKRTYRSKWRVSTKEYSDKYYPSHCPGFSIIYSADVAQKLYFEAQKQRYFWIDDVFITGTVATKSNITITSVGNYYLTQSKRNKLFEGHFTSSSLNFFFTQPNLNEKEIRQLWKIVTSQNVSQDMNDVR